MPTLVDELAQVAHEAKHQGISSEAIRTKLKETLQFYVLDFIYNSPKYQHLVFYGGTCLRICFRLNRMSEEIDFETTTPFDKKQFAHDVSQHFQQKIQYRNMCAVTPGASLQRIELKFPLLHTLGLSQHEAANLIVKVEVNQTQHVYPTAVKTVSQDRLSFIIRHYDLPTLMAGKMCACLHRVWEKRGVIVKGRDYYDLVWYMQKAILPNRERLAASGTQTIGGAFEEIRAKVHTIKPAHLVADLEILFENSVFPRRWAATFSEEFEQLYQQYAAAPFVDECDEKSWSDFVRDTFIVQLKYRNLKGRSLTFRFHFSKEWIANEAREEMDTLLGLLKQKIGRFIDHEDYRNLIPGEWPVKMMVTHGTRKFDATSMVALRFQELQNCSLQDLLAKRETL